MATNLKFTSAYLARFSGVAGNLGSTDFTYLALGSGLANLNTGLTNGNTYTSLDVAGTLYANVTAGQSITLVYGIYSQTLTVSTNTSAGASSIPVNSFVANATYAGGLVASIISTPSASTTLLDHERLRIPFTLGTPGLATGEEDITYYFSPSQANNFIIAELGWFVDNSGVANAGTLGAKAAYNLGTGQKTSLQSLQIQIAITPTSLY